MKFQLLFFFYLLIAPVLFSLHAQAWREYIEKEESGVKYGLVLPVNYNPNRKYLLGVCLHGLGGNGIDFAIRLGYYSRYMNMILVCPNGNIPDIVRNSTKWGEDSPDYLFNFLRQIQLKYPTTGKIVLFGFSQGGNLGLNLSLSNPELFSHFIGLSGGYLKTSPEMLESIGKFHILLLSGDKGNGEIYTKKALDAKYKQLSHKGKNVTRITVRGEEHELSPRMNYTAMKWYAKTNPFFKPNFWIFRGNYYPVYLNALSKFENADYKKSIELVKKSLQLNPVFPPSHLLFLESALKTGKLTSMQKAIFMTLQFYSNDPFFDARGIFHFFEEFYVTIQNDIKLKEYYFRVFSEKVLEVEDTLLPVYSGELYFFLFKLQRQSENKIEAEGFKEKAKYYFSQVPTDDPLYKQGNIEGKLQFLSSP